jgi:hypothetical protein
LPDKQVYQKTASYAKIKKSIGNHNENRTQKHKEMKKLKKITLKHIDVVQMGTIKGGNNKP